MNQLQENNKQNQQLSQSDKLSNPELTNPDITDELEEIEEEMDNQLDPDLKEYALRMLSGKMAFLKRDNDQEESLCGCW